jgi:hypothetical protein
MHEAFGASLLSSRTARNSAPAGRPSQYSGFFLQIEDGRPVLSGSEVASQIDQTVNFKSLFALPSP